tara:strand:- start:416 stop:709 length:294 start_codon:yes stop_codon:yes gene_type:complete
MAKTMYADYEFGDNPVGTAINFDISKYKTPKAAAKNLAKALEELAAEYGLGKPTLEDTTVSWESGGYEWVYATDFKDYSTDLMAEAETSYSVTICES